MEKFKITVTTIISILMSWLGILAIPVFLLVGCNLIDYFTGLIAAKYREELINSYKGFRGILKKICMWILIMLGAFMDILLQYAADTIGLTIALPFIVATVVAVWLICNEFISILENVLDIGLEIPPFLLPLAKYIKKQMEDKLDMEREES